MAQTSDDLNLIERLKSFTPLDVTFLDKRSGVVYDAYGRPSTQSSIQFDDVDYVQPELSSTNQAYFDGHPSVPYDGPQSTYNETPLQSYFPRPYDGPQSTYNETPLQSYSKQYDGPQSTYNDAKHESFSPRPYNGLQSTYNETPLQSYFPRPYDGPQSTYNETPLQSYSKQYDGSQSTFSEARHQSYSPRQHDGPQSTYNEAPLQSYSKQYDGPQSTFSKAQHQSYSPRQHGGPQSTYNDAQLKNYPQQDVYQSTNSEAHHRWQNYPTVIRIQPTTNANNEQETPEFYDFRCLSVFSFLFCLFTPIGVVAMVFAFQSKSNADRGEKELAARNSSIAHKLAIITILTGICIYLGVGIRFLYAYLHLK